MQDVYKAIGRVSSTEATVLIRGESGTGKELAARAVYSHSLRADKPFQVINCVAIPETLLESELFGFEKGAFTGAAHRRVGKIEQANGGTVFLDEIGDMPFGIQSKILRLLQERSIERLGGRETIKVDVRIIAATNRDLETALEQGRFREDLYYRLKVVTITLPPLRERLDDIPLLVDYFLRRYAAELDIDNPGITPEAVTLLNCHRWPGNVRELANVLESAAMLCKKDFIDVANLPKYLRDYIPPQGAVAFAGNGRLSSLSDLEKEYIAYLLKVTKGNLRQTAKILSISRTTLYNKLAKYGIRN